MKEAPTQTERFPFNINHAVWVKLTDVGRAELKRQDDELYESIGRMGKPFTLPVPDADGWTKFSTWDLMNRLGHLCGMGRPVPFETTVLLERTT